MTGETNSTNEPPSPSFDNLLTTSKDFVVISTTENSNTCPHQCPEGYCIPLNLVCDGISQCSDNSDENNCQPDYNVEKSTEKSNTCPHQCPEGYCIPEHLICDGTSQCSDESDEINCKIEIIPMGNVACHQCQSDGYCIPLHLVCNGKNQCSDNSDEINCQENKLGPSCHQCQLGDCIPLHLICTLSGKVQ